MIDFPDTGHSNEDADIYFLEKSRDKIKNWAEILVFVFDQECNNDSVLVEFFYTVESVTHKCINSTIISSSERYLGSLLRGTVKLYHIRFREFSDIDEMKRKGYSTVFQITQEIHDTE